MNSITYTQAVKLITEIETATGRFGGKAPTPVKVTLDENGVAYVCAADDAQCCYAKAQAGRDGRDGRAILARWIG